MDISQQTTQLAPLNGRFKAFKALKARIFDLQRLLCEQQLVDDWR